MDHPGIEHISGTETIDQGRGRVSRAGVKPPLIIHTPGALIAPGTAKPGGGGLPAHGEQKIPRLPEPPGLGIVTGKEEQSRTDEKVFDAGSRSISSEQPISGRWISRWSSIKRVSAGARPSK